MRQSVIVENISKYYNNIKALNSVSFDVKKGELFGIIGPDGAGKTSLFRILATLLIQDKGTATVEGFDVIKDYRRIRKIVGYMPGRFSLYQDLSVEENLNFFASIFNTTIEDNYHLVKDIYQQIEPFKKRLAGRLSGGMKQKLALSCALIHSPEVLYLDEPTTGVDAVSRKEFWEMLKRLQEKGITILVSTPYMDEAELCDRVGLLQKGKLLDINTPQGIIEQYEYPLFAVSAHNMADLIKDLKKYPDTVSAYRFGDNIHLTVTTKKKLEENLFNWLSDKNYKQIYIKETEPNIEDCFMALMTNN